MAKSSLDTTKIVYVEWIDIIATEGEWINDDELQDWIAEKKCLVRQVGFLYSETKDYIVLVDSKFDDDTRGYAIKIPKGCIIKMKKIKI